MSDSATNITGFVGSLRHLLRLVYDFAVTRDNGTLMVGNFRGQWSAGFGRGHIRSLSLPTRFDRPLGTILLTAGLLDRAGLEESLRIARTQNRLHGQVLVAQGLAPERLWEALKTQTVSKFDRFLREARGSFSFRRGTVLQSQKSLGVPLDVVTALRKQFLWIARSEARSEFELRIRGRVFRADPTRVPPAWSLTADEQACLRAVSEPTRLERILCSVPDPDGALEFLCFMDTMGALEYFDTKINEGKQPRIDHRMIPDEDERNIPQTLDELRRWWRKAARRYHPDLNAELDPIEQRVMATRFIRLREQYEHATTRLKK